MRAGSGHNHKSGRTVVLSVTARFHRLKGPRAEASCKVKRWQAVTILCANILAEARERVDGRRDRAHSRQDTGSFGGDS